MGPALGTCSFKYEMRGNGTGGGPDFAPALAALIQACGFSVTGVVYSPSTPISGQKTVTIGMWQDGTYKQLQGCMGELSIEGEYGKPLYANFEFHGVWSPPTDVALPAMVADAAVAPRFAGVTLSLDAGDAAAPVIDKFTLKMGNKVEAMKDVTAPQGVSYYYVSDRSPTITIAPQATLAATYDWFAKKAALAQLAFSLLVGATAGNKFTIAAPKVQIKSLKEQDRNNILANEIEAQCCYNAGDDDVVLTPS
jgi:hypothetical protein